MQLSLHPVAVSLMLTRQAFNCIFESYICRYKESYQVALQHRQKAQEEERVASRNEQMAQRHVDLTHNVMVSPAHGSSGGLSGASGGEGRVNGTSNGHSNGAGHASNGHGGNGSGMSSPATTASASSTSTNGSTSSSTESKGAGSSTTSPGTSSNSTSAGTGERAVNQAKLDLAAAEDLYEQKRAAADQVNATLRAESARLETLEKAQLVVSCCFPCAVLFFMDCWYSMASVAVRPNTFRF